MKYRVLALLAVSSVLIICMSCDRSRAGAGKEGGAKTPSEVVSFAFLYSRNCAGCHGANLEGQPDWQKRLPLGNFPAPPHYETGHTWHHADQWLFDIVQFGGPHFATPRYRSAMPAYKDILTEEEIWSVLSFIKSRWTPSIRAQQEQETVRDQR